MMRQGSWRARAALPLSLVALAVLAAPARSADAQGIGLSELRDMMGWKTSGLILADQLEYAPGADGRPVVLEALGWYGGAYNRLWFRLEGDQRTTSRAGDAEAHLYYGRLITPFWDALVGVRADARWFDDRGARAHLALGLIGLAPLRFELAPALFVSHQGDVSARLEADYRLLLTQRLSLVPEIELNAALQEAPEWGVGAGLSDIELAARLRYEIRREIAPYVGVVWLRRVAATASLARDADEPVSEASVVLGVRLWR